MAKQPERKYLLGSVFLRWLLIGIAALLLLHLIGQFILRVVGTDNIFLQELIWRFNVDLELNVPTWYSSFLASSAGLLAFFTAHYYKKKNQIASKRLWLFMGFGLMAIAVDEVASFHELFLQTAHVAADFGDGQSYVQNAWLLLLPLIIIIGALVMYLLYKGLPKKTFHRIVVAAAVYLSGALVVEYLSIPVDTESLIYNLVLTPLEEGLEMLGLWLILRALVLHITDHHPSVVDAIENQG